MFKFLKYFICSLLVIFIGLCLLIFEGESTVDADASAQVGYADTVQSLVTELKSSVRKRYTYQTINISEEQANSIAGFAQRAREQLIADIKFNDKKATLRGSYRISTWFGNVFLNVLIEVSEGESVSINSLKLGKLPLPPQWSLSTAERLANAYTSSHVASKAIETVQYIRITDDRLSVDIAPLDTFLREFKNIKTGGSAKDTRILKIRIAHYLRLLDNFNIEQDQLSNGRVPLELYISVLMREAHEMSIESSATLENEAAILALAIYAGHHRFAALVGDLSFAIDTIPYVRNKPTLLNREDLSLHFIFSAAIKLMSEKGISIAIGEFKELMDRGEGGSGYSFVDLAADLSGANFAALAVEPKTAKHVQNVLKHKPDASLFMVSTLELEEGLDKQEFELKYGKVDSEQYVVSLDEINQRIAQLSISSLHK